MLGRLYVLVVVVGSIGGGGECSRDGQTDVDWLKGRR
jgi:hypothetical protein